MTKINPNNSFSKLIKQVTEDALETNPFAARESREILSLNCSDYFKMHFSLDEIKKLSSNGDNPEYDFLYSYNTSLILRRYVYNVLCTKEDNYIYYLDLKYTLDKSQSTIKGLEYTRVDEEFIEFCFKVLKRRMQELGFDINSGKAESFRKSLRNYLYLKSNISKSNIIKNMSFMLGMSYENVIYILENLEYSTLPENNIEEAALNKLKALDQETNPNYLTSYNEISHLEKTCEWRENNHEFFKLVQYYFPKQDSDFDTSINLSMIDCDIDIDSIAHISTSKSKYEFFLKDLRRDFLQDECAKNIYYRKNTPLKKRHILYLYFYICILNHDEFFIEGDLKELDDYFIKPANITLKRFGFSEVNYKNYFDKFLMLCLLNSNPAKIFNRVMVNRG